MRSLEKGQDKIQKICDKLRREVIDPAKIDAEDIIKEAKAQAEEILAEAERQSEQVLKQARGQIEQEKNVFYSSLKQAAKQTLEVLKQEIEGRFFNEELQSVLEKQLSDPKVIAEIVNGLITAIEKEGIATDLSVVIPKVASTEDVNALLIEGVKKRLKGNSLELGKFVGGAQVKLHGKKMTLDLTDQALKELLSNYLRKDFRNLIFSN